MDTFTRNIGIADIPFKYCPDFKDVAKRDWADEDGIDVYIPKQRKLKEYDMDIEFIYKGTKDTIHHDLKAFIDFFRHKKADGSFAESRFAMYDDHTKVGRKDVICETNFANVDLFYYEDGDNDGIASFKLKFLVCDPSTDVSLNAEHTALYWEE